MNLKKKENKLSVRFVVAGLATAFFSTVVHATTVELAAAKLFEGAFVEYNNNLPEDGPVIADFKEDYPAYEDVVFSMTFGPAGTYASQIADDLDDGVSTYNLFISADSDLPSELYDDFVGNVSSPVVVSQGKLMHWSNGVIDMESSWPGGFLNYYNNNATTIGICNTANGPYGAAAVNVLYSAYSIPATAATQYSNIMMVDNAVRLQTMDSGFVPTALHCSAGAVSLTSGTAHVFNETYDHAAVQIYSGDTDVDTVVAAFVSWLSGSSGQAVLEDYCLAF